ncbi:hypothetical protein QCA50_019417 [Cerrena zonata]|uniref:RING-type domain-containing protein n=1 Tax=Cerrena zonata TaxID=2478898 RepID=A0AAW0FAX7_9APHY
MVVSTRSRSGGDGKTKVPSSHIDRPTHRQFHPGSPQAINRSTGTRLAIAASHKNGTTVGIRARMKARAGKKQASGSNVHIEDELHGEAPSGAQRLGEQNQDPPANIAAPPEDSVIPAQLAELEYKHPRYSPFAALPDSVRLRLELSLEKKKRIISLQGQIESYLCCSICFEIFIHPQTISCGHTFCAKCIVSWYFTKMDCATSSWPSGVECPECCQSMTALGVEQTPEKLPFPFISNQIVEMFLYDAVKTVYELMVDMSIDDTLENIPEGFLRRALKWGKGGKGQEEWLNNTRYVESLDAHAFSISSILSDIGKERSATLSTIGRPSPAMS